MSKNKSNWSTEKIVSITAITISIVTLIIFVQQTQIMKRQNYLSILPYLTISTTTNEHAKTFELNLINQGVGPAIIESVTFIYEGERYDLADYDHYMLAFLQDKVPELDSLINVSSSSLDKGMAIPANTSYNVIRVKESEKDFYLITQTLTQLLEEGFDYEIIYKSIQHERWKIYNNSEGPERL